MKLDLEDIEYRISVYTYCRWRGDYGWNYSQKSEEILYAESLEKLYEEIGTHYSKWIVEKELNQQNAGKHPDDDDLVENNFIEYSDITVFIESYSEEKRNQTEGYKNVGAIRDAARAKAAEKAEKERIRREEWNKKEKERKEREEFERLKAKFEEKR